MINMGLSIGPPLVKRQQDGHARLAFSCGSLVHHQVDGIPVG
jgi:hypothetical protein